MAWRWPDRKKSESGEWTGFLEQGVRFEGKLEASGTLRIDSMVKGTLVSHETLILGEHAVVEGQIIGHHVLIDGRFNGTIQARGRVEIRRNAIVSGQIETPCLIVEPGSVFDGECQMLVEKEASRSISIPVRSVVATAGAAN
jgi:cytoskeletal protein CcmA (bactofilin family)